MCGSKIKEICLILGILFVFSKINENIEHTKLYDYLTNTGLLSETQFGFRQDHSTSQAAPQISDTVNNSFQRDEIPLTMLGDFRKAFDTDDFEILTKRLERLGVKGACLNRFKIFCVIDLFRLLQTCSLTIVLKKKIQYIFVPLFFPK